LPEIKIGYLVLFYFIADVLFAPYPIRNGYKKKVTDDVASDV